MRGEVVSDESGSAAVASTPKNVVKKRKIHRPTLAMEAQSSPALKEVDDSEEITSRNLNRLMEQATKYASPHVSPERRKSIVTNAGMTNAQIVDHYTSCLKMSAENKITLKNAFNLHLIDLMDSVLSKQTETNFQAAGSTLDASAKIYAYRVDCVHQETYKIAGGLGRSDKNFKKDKGELDQDVVNEDICQPKDEPSVITVATKKKKKKTVKGCYVETNEKLLNMAGNEVKFESDELFENVRSSFDEGSALGLFSNTLQTTSDNNRLVLHSLCDFPAIKPLSLNAVDVSGVLSLMSIGEETTSNLCPPLKEFKFLNWNSDEDDASLYVSPVKKIANNFAARIDAEEIANDWPHNGLEEEAPDDEEFSSDVVENNAESENLGAIPKFPTLDAVASALSRKDLEYSYFDPNILSTWAGPERWKTKVPNHERFTADGLEENDSEGSAHNKKPKRTKKTAKPKSDGRVDLNEDFDIDKFFAFGKASTVYPKSTLQKFVNQTHTLDAESDYKPSFFKSLFLKPSMGIKMAVSSPSHTAEGINEYDMNNDVDRLNYCPDTQVDDDNEAEMTFGDIGGDMRADSPELGPSTSGYLPTANEVAATSENLHLDETDFLKQPYTVNKIQVNYAKQAKRIDVRRLKQSIWQVLTRDQTADYRSPINTPSRLKSETMFTDLCKELPEVLPPQAVDGLSVATALTVLLHMCNEKTLALESTSDFGDVKIFQG